MIRFRSGDVRCVTVCLCVCFVIAGGVVVPTGQTVPTEEEYGPLMTEIRFTVGDAEQHVDSRYWPELGEDLDKLVPMFRQVEAFWAARGNSEAVGFATEALAALDELGDAAVDMNTGTAGEAITTLRGTCRVCHQNHREQTDNGYRIKPGS